uniref:B30.2/SPRY domain-containing protein n=1 Tax=Periophthalmus magnuspinnatus TaxID=409849 RepID=A0A3B4AKL3_9GOBI
AERHAQELSRGLESELSQLRRRSSEMDALAQTQDRVMFLQVPHCSATCGSGGEEHTDLIHTRLTHKPADLDHVTLSCPVPGEVYLDPSTAQKNLVVSEDGRQVKYDEHKTSHTDMPKRFSPALFVLAREGLSSGRHYWEVDVSRKDAWTIGVARGSSRRKGDIKLSPEGGFWCLWLKNGEVKALATVRLPLHLSSAPAKVGVYLDYDGGQVSFYDVKARLHLYTFTDTFSESLFPIFSPCLSHDGKNSAPLVITNIKHT